MACSNKKKIEMHKRTVKNKKYTYKNIDITPVLTIITSRPILDHPV